jgi:hypothetical protein
MISYTGNCEFVKTTPIFYQIIQYLGLEWKEKCPIVCIRGLPDKDVY